MTRQLRHFNPCTINDSNPIAELFDMIARKGPLLMRAGGGSLSAELLRSGQRIGAEGAAKILRVYGETKCMRETARQTGVHYSTVAKITRKVRQS